MPESLFWATAFLCRS